MKELQLIAYPLFNFQESKPDWGKYLLKPILCLLGIFLFSSAIAQYQSTLNPGKSWTVLAFHYFNERITDSLFVNGIMELDDHEYAIIQCESFAFNGTLALMREDTTEGKVWVRYYNPQYPASELDPALYNKEYLLADYSLGIGDTLTYSVVLDVQWAPVVIDVLLTVTDTGNVAGRGYVELNTTTDSILDVFYFYGFGLWFDSHYAIDNIPLRFYEGLGTSHSPIFPFGGSEVYASDPYVTCAYENGIQIWQDPFVDACHWPVNWIPTGLPNDAIYQQIKSIPNPNNGFFKLDLVDNLIGKDYQLKIYASMGKTVTEQSGRIESKYLPLDLSQQPAGIYYLHFIANKTTYMLKILRI